MPEPLLAVFPGSFDLTAVEAVCGMGSDSVVLLGSLVGRSLVVLQETSRTDLPTALCGTTYRRHCGSSRNRATFWRTPRMTSRLPG